MFVGADTVAEWTTASFGTLLFTIILGVAMVFGRLIIIHRQRFDLVSFTPPHDDEDLRSFRGGRTDELYSKPLKIHSIFLVRWV